MTIQIRSLLVVVFFLFSQDFVFAEDFGGKCWDEVAQVLAQPKFIHPSVSSELKTEYRSASGTKIYILNKLEKAALKPDFFEVLQSIVFMRAKVGLEVLEDHLLIKDLDIALKTEVYRLTRVLLGALIVSGENKLNSGSKEQLISTVAQFQFSKAFIEALWNRFYTPNGIRRSQHQLKVVSVAYLEADRGIGFENHLPWGMSMPTDFRRFMGIAIGHWGILSSRNWKSNEMGAKRMRGTENIVVSRDPYFKADDAFVVPTIEAALELAQADPQVVIYGGRMIYELALNKKLVDRIYVTEIKAQLPTDTFFPEVSLDQFELVEDSGFVTQREDKYPFRFLTYKRKELQ